MSRWMPADAVGLRPIPRSWALVAVGLGQYETKVASGRSARAAMSRVTSSGELQGDGEASIGELSSGIQISLLTHRGKQQTQLDDQGPPARIRRVWAAGVVCAGRERKVPTTKAPTYQSAKQARSRDPQRRSRITAFVDHEKWDPRSAPDGRAVADQPAGHAARNPLVGRPVKSLESVQRGDNRFVVPIVADPPHVSPLPHPAPSAILPVRVGFGQGEAMSIFATTASIRARQDEADSVESQFVSDTDAGSLVQRLTA